MDKELNYILKLEAENSTLQSDLDEAQKALEDVMDVNDKLRAGLLELPKFGTVYEKAYLLDRDNMTVATFYECLKQLYNAEKIIKELENENNISC